MPTPEEPLQLSDPPRSRLKPRSQWTAEKGTTVFLGAAGPLTLGAAPQITSYAQFEREMAPSVPSASCLPSAIRGFFANGGRSCYVISVAESVDGVGPDCFYPESSQRGGLALAETLRDASMICAPDVVRAHQIGAIDDAAVRALQFQLVAFCERSGLVFAILDPLADLRPEEAYEFRNQLNDTDFAALYYPWIQPRAARGFVPPSGHVAGLFAGADTTIGPHSAPLQVEIRDLADLAVDLTRDEITLLWPAGINPIVRMGSSAGLQAARTLSREPQWRQIPWVRTAAFITRNVSAGMGWALRGNARDRATWDQFGSDLEHLLHLLWRGGALSGDTPNDAYRVVCDPRSADPEAVRMNRLVAEAQVSLQEPLSCRMRFLCQLD